MKFLLLVAVFACVALAADVHITEDLVREINNKQSTWVASTEQSEFMKTATKSQIKVLLGVKDVPNAPKLPRKTYNVDIKDLPENFEAADKWPNCATVTQIRDQSACGSCWAFGAAEAISDRYCTFSSTPKNITISANDLVSCCGLFQGCGMGCNGGQPSGAWAYWVSTGLVDDACDPYPYPACAHHVNSTKYKPCPSSEYPTPSCQTTCNNGADWGSSLHKGTNSWTVQGEADYMQELYAHGPFEVAFTVYSDFPSYKSGVYTHTSGDELGGHAVRLVGWGVLNGVKYWKIANSWNDSWGANGYFLIKRGTDECGIEDSGVAGQP